MRFTPRVLALALACCALASGCGLNTVLSRPGGNGCMGVLLNHSCGAAPCDPIDPSKPTIVLTHGWNPLPNKIHSAFGPASAAVIKRRCGDSYNILSWDWNGVRISPFRDEPLRVGKVQGRKMAAALRARGVVPCRTQIVAHSLGTIAISQAAVCLSDLGPFAQLTLLDAPETYHEQIFGELCPQRHARVVENYWAPGISGFGYHADYPGVRNYIVRGTTPIRGIFDLSISNHVYVMQWYYDTIRCPSVRGGFNFSVMLKYCGRNCPAVESYDEGDMPVETDSVNDEAIGGPIEEVAPDVHISGGQN